MVRIDDFFIGVGVGGLIMAIIIVFYPIVIESKHRIEPTLEITVKEGKADTTFIYGQGE